ncbi:MAG: DUF4831 family protein [Bacteroidaceae bacterium]|nr:DUF4831 family protein [Bacteroidaceae bacterium]
MKKKHILSGMLLAFSMAAGAQTQVTEFTPGVVAEGVNYYLPKTTINVDVEVQKVVYTPGEFARYAERFLHVTNVAMEEDVKHEIKRLQVYPKGTPDKDKCFTIKMKDKSSASNVQLTKSGILACINTPYKEEAHAEIAERSTSNRLDSKKYLTGEILNASSTAKMAELTAQEIFDIRDSKNALKRGEVESMPKDGATMQIMLDELELQETALMQLFVGYSDTIVSSKTYSCIPSAELDKEVFFRFSTKLGLVDADDVSGEPYYISVRDQKTVQMPAPDAKRKIQGVVYNMPSMADVKIFSATKTLYQKEMPIAQFGTIDVLNYALFNKGAAPKVAFNVASGALLWIE